MFYKMLVCCWLPEIVALYMHNKISIKQLPSYLNVCYNITRYYEYVSLESRMNLLILRNLVESTSRVHTTASEHVSDISFHLLNISRAS